MSTDTVVVSGITYGVFTRAAADSYANLLAEVIAARGYPGSCSAFYDAAIARARVLQPTFSRHRFTGTPKIAGVAISGRWAGGAWLTLPQDRQLLELAAAWETLQASECAVGTALPAAAMPASITPSTPDRSGMMYTTSARPYVESNENSSTPANFEVKSPSLQQEGSAAPGERYVASQPAPQRRISAPQRTYTPTVVSAKEPAFVLEQEDPFVPSSEPDLNLDFPQDPPSDLPQTTSSFGKVALVVGAVGAVALLLKVIR